VVSDDELPIVLDELRLGREPAGVAELALRRLTARETEILRALASGEATGEIADELGISPLTVQSHVKGIPEHVPMIVELGAVHPTIVTRPASVLLSPPCDTRALGRGCADPGSR